MLVETLFYVVIAILINSKHATSEKVDNLKSSSVCYFMTNTHYQGIFKPWSSVGMPRQTHASNGAVMKKFLRRLLVFTGQFEGNQKEAVEIAYVLKNGRCKFLIRNPGKSHFSTSEEMPCKPGIVGEKGLFLAKLTSLFNFQSHLFSSNHPFQEEHLFPGSKHDVSARKALGRRIRTWRVFVIDTYLQCRRRYNTKY